MIEEDCESQTEEIDFQSQRLILIKDYLAIVKLYVIETYFESFDVQSNRVHEALNCMYFMSKSAQSLESLAQMTEQYILMWIDSCGIINPDSDRLIELAWYFKQCVQAICDKEDPENTTLICDLHHLRKFLNLETE